MDRDAETKPHMGAGDRPEHQPRVADALKSGVSVSISTWSGRELRGTISDRDQAGLLLDIETDGDDADGYTFVPWSSVEQVDIPKVAHRRVKFLQG